MTEQFRKKLYKKRYRERHREAGAAYMRERRKTWTEDDLAHNAYMRECRRKRKASWTEEDWAAQRAADSAYYKQRAPELKEKARQKKLAHYAANPELYRARNKRSAAMPHNVLDNRKRSLARLGWTLEAYDEAHEKQQGLCAICGMPETAQRFGKVIRLSADHCHKTNNPRELLCFNCNSALGLLEDNPDRMIAASEYIKKHEQITAAMAA